MPKQVDHIGDLKPDPTNPRIHSPRNIGMISDSLRKVGAARSIVIDENDVILAGNGVIDAAAEAGIEKVRVIEADGDEIIAVRRTGLTDEQKQILSYFDNRTAELASWDAQQIVADLDAKLDLSGMFYEEELLGILDKAASAAPDLDDLATQYGEPQERDFWPFIRIQVSPDTLDYFYSLMEKAPGVDGAAKVQTLLEAVDVSLFDTGLS